jgi:hypothetical protein
MQNEYESIRSRYTHWRAPEAYREVNQGKPKLGDVYLYSRSNGWYDKALRIIDRAAWKKHVRPAARGGATICQIVDSYGHTVAVGLALCSFSDNFCYETGRTLALGRALRQLGSFIEDIPEV